ncbi:hypothetical protein KDL44_13580 [bacterium]|nr:hypothetical protein [bacterium]
MRAEAQNRAAAGKPQYTPRSLSRLTALDLHARLERIDNPLAHEVAAELWTRILRMSMVPREVIDRQEPGLHVRRMAGGNTGRLLRLLDELRHASLAEAIVADSSGLRELLGEGSLLQRLGGPLPVLDSTDKRVEFLLRFLECLKRPPWKTDWQSMERLRGLAHLVLNLGFFVSLAMGGSRTVLPGLAAAALLIIGLLVWKFLYERVRLLALYISFTDEFVEPEAVLSGTV